MIYFIIISIVTIITEAYHDYLRGNKIHMPGYKPEGFFWDRISKLIKGAIIMVALITFGVYADGFRWYEPLYIYTIIRIIMFNFTYAYFDGNVGFPLRWVDIRWVLLHTEIVYWFRIIFQRDSYEKDEFRKRTM